MRIIGGAWGGRRLKAPRGSGTRPTSDRVREAIFNILGPPDDGTRVLDLCAGAGTLGLEALSRGAQRAVFVERSPPALKALTENIAAVGAQKASQVQRQEVKTALRSKRLGQFEWIFLDPPYHTPLASELLAILGAGELLGPGAVIVLEHDRRTEADLSHGCLVRTDQRRYGDTAVSFYRTEA